MATKRDYYSILGVGKGASQDEIRKAHRKLVRQFHPDANRDNPAAAERFSEVQEAYDVLSDAEKRQQYDQLGHAAFNPHMSEHAGQQGAYDPYEAFRRASTNRNYRSWRGAPNVTVEDFDTQESGGAFSDIFEQFFGRGDRRQRQEPTDKRGKDIDHSVTISFAEAARGCTVPIRMVRDGRTESIDLKVPAGVKTGSRVRLRGKGETVAAGRPGDLYITTKVSDHPYFRREDLDVYLDLPISLYEAILGTKVEVPTLDGKVTLTVPPLTSSGAKLRIRGRGIKRGDDAGDQFAVIKVMVPKELDQSAREAVEEMARKHPFNPREGLRW